MIVRMGPRLTVVFNHDYTFVAANEVFRLLHGIIRSAVLLVAQTHMQPNPGEAHHKGIGNQHTTRCERAVYAVGSGGVLLKRQS